MLQMPGMNEGPEAGGMDFDLSFLDEVSQPNVFNDSLGFTPNDVPGAEGAIMYSGIDLERLKYRVDHSLSRAKRKMEVIHRDAMLDRQVYKTLEREQEYPGQPNLTTPISANKADGLLAHVIDAIEQRPLASFVPEGIGRPAERASQVAPLCAAYLEREINRGGSRERLVRELNKEAVKVGTGIAKLGAVQHPSGEWFMQITGLIPIERFFVDRVAVPNLKHCFSAYEERIPYYQLEEMADAGLIDHVALEVIRNSHSSAFIRTLEEQEAGIFEDSQAFQEETVIHKIYYCYLRFRPEGGGRAEMHEVIWSEQWKEVLAVRLNPVREAFDHPPLSLARIGKEAGHLFGRGIMRRLAPIQQMSDNAVNSHLAINDLAASPPFLYREHSPFGRLMHSKRRIVPGIGIPTLNAPDQGDVRVLDQFKNPGLALQDMGVAQNFADKATYTEEAIGSSQGSRKTLGQFRVEVQRGTMRVRLDLGDLAYDHAMTLTMLWAMMNAYKIKVAGIVEVEEGGRFLADRDIHEEEITRVMNSIIEPMFQSGEIGPQDLLDLEQDFNERLTDDMIPSGRRSDLTIHLTGTKVIADKAAELEMLGELTPLILQGLDLAREDSYFNYHLRSIIDAMGFKDVEKRVPPDPGKVITDPMQRQQLGAPLAETISRSSNMV